MSEDLPDRIPKFLPEPLKLGVKQPGRAIGEVIEAACAFIVEIPSDK